MAARVRHSSVRACALTSMRKRVRRVKHTARVDRLARDARPARAAAGQCPTIKGRKSGARRRPPTRSAGPPHARPHAGGGVPRRLLKDENLGRAPAPAGRRHAAHACPRCSARPAGQHAQRARACCVGARGCTLAHSSVRGGRARRAGATTPGGGPNCSASCAGAAPRARTHAPACAWWHVENFGHRKMPLYVGFSLIVTVASPNWA
jgi:hypothetical protein